MDKNKEKKLVRLKSYSIEAEARMIASLLESSGVHCVVQDTYPAGYPNQIQGAEIFISEKDVDKAKEIISKQTNK